MVSTVRMRTTISPQQWQPWTAVSPLLGLMVVRMRKVLAIPRSNLRSGVIIIIFCFFASLAREGKKITPHTFIQQAINRPLIYII